MDISWNVPICERVIRSLMLKMMSGNDESIISEMDDSERMIQFAHEHGSLGCSIDIYEVGLMIIICRGEPAKSVIYG